jgi:hypothetical protein
VSDYVDDILFVSRDERLRGGIFLDEFEEDRDGVFAVGADEESDGDEKAEGVRGELFLDESEVRRGEGREGDAGYDSPWSARAFRCLL